MTSVIGCNSRIGKKGISFSGAANDHECFGRHSRFSKEILTQRRKARQANAKPAFASFAPLRVMNPVFDSTISGARYLSRGALAPGSRIAFFAAAFSLANADAPQG